MKTEILRRLKLSESTVPAEWRRYLEVHCDPCALEDHINTVYSYFHAVRDPVLDWGCMQGIDSLLMSLLGFETYQCDVTPVWWFNPTRGRIPYTRLVHPYELPFLSEAFSSVVASGTLEHVPHLHESLGELWRILKPNGTLIVTNCPQRYSLIEAVKRRTHPPAAHKRLFTWDELYRVLVDHGFAVETMRCHNSTPMLQDHRNVLTLALRRLFPSWIERVPVVRAVTQNLMCIARKQDSV